MSHSKIYKYLIGVCCKINYFYSNWINFFRFAARRSSEGECIATKLQLKCNLLQALFLGRLIESKLFSLISLADRPLKSDLGSMRYFVRETFSHFAFICWVGVVVLRVRKSSVNAKKKSFKAQHNLLFYTLIMSFQHFSSKIYVCAVGALRRGSGEAHCVDIFFLRSPQRASTGWEKERKKKERKTRIEIEFLPQEEDVLA